MLFQGFYCMGRKSLELKQKQNTSETVDVLIWWSKELRIEQNNVQPTTILTGLCPTIRDLYFAPPSDTDICIAPQWRDESEV